MKTSRTAQTKKFPVLKLTKSIRGESPLERQRRLESPTTDTKFPLTTIAKKTTGGSKKMSYKKGLQQ